MKSFFTALILLTALFCLAIGFDLSPFLRGPAPYFPDWRWAYYFVNTIGKLWVPFLIIVAILTFFLFSEKKKQFVESHSKRFFLLLIILNFAFQFGVLFFSRSGIPVLVNRIISPDLNGYFTTALGVKDIPEFLKHFDTNVLFFANHAQGHPPGAVFFFSLLIMVFSWIPVLGKIALHFTPTHGDVLAVWNTLAPTERASALFSGFFIPFLSTLTVIPLYYCAKLLYGVKAAIRTVFLYIFLPNVVLFIPINDVFLPFFTALTLLFLLKGIFSDRTRWFFWAGIVFSMGLFFSLSLLPLAFAYLLLFVLYGRKQKKLFTWNYLLSGCLFLVGISTLPIALFVFFQFNAIEVARTLMHGLPESRAYSTWVFYNLYDFLIFSGIPVAIIFLTLVGKFVKNFLFYRSARVSIIFFSFMSMLLVLDISGSVRGEVGRIWLPFMPFMAIIAAQFLTSQKNFTTKMFAVLLLLQAAQILVMQEFWVMLY